MGQVTVFMERIQCHKTTEAGHDEVYYIPALARRTAQQITALPGYGPGPNGSQGGNAGGFNGANTAWDCNDSGNLADQHINVALVGVPVDAGDNVFVTLTMKESDNSNYADIEKDAAAITGAVLAAVTASFPPSAIVTAPAVAIIGVITGVTQALKSLLVNRDDDLGAMTFTLQGLPDGSVTITEAGVGNGQLSLLNLPNQSPRLTAHLTGDGANYDFTFRSDGALSKSTHIASVPGGGVGPGGHGHGPKYPN